MRVKVEQNVNNAWFWKLIGDNGECLAVSEAYSSKTKCNQTAKKVEKVINGKEKS